MSFKQKQGGQGNYLDLLCNICITLANIREKCCKNLLGVL